MFHFDSLANKHCNVNYRNLFTANSLILGVSLDLCSVRNVVA